MAHLIRYRVLSALMLLAITFSVFVAFPQSRALPRAEAAEAGVTEKGQEEAPASDFTVPRPVGQGNGQEPEAGGEALPASESLPELWPASAPLPSEQAAEDYVFAALYTHGSPNANGIARWNGAAWELKNEGLTGQALRVNEIAADPFNPNVLLVATEDGVYRTQNALGACTWTRVFEGYTPPLSVILSIEAHPWNQGEFFAGSAGSADSDGPAPYFFKTTDGGNSWITRTLPLEPLGIRRFWSKASDICLGTASGSAIYVPNPNEYDWRRQFWKSTDEGDTFDRIDNRISHAPRLCAAEPGTDNVVYMANDQGTVSFLDRTTDGGQSWDNIDPTPDEGQSAVEVSPFDLRLWAASNSGPILWWSDDGGNSWSSHTLSYKARSIGFGGPGEVWVGGALNHVWMSPDNGSTWIASTIPATTNYDVSDIVPLGRYAYRTLPYDQCNSNGSTCGSNTACGWTHYWPGGEVNTGNGNHSYQVKDLSLPTVGGALTFERTYASQQAKDAGPLSYGWTHNYDVRLSPPAMPGGMVVVTSADGSRLRFIGNGEGVYTPYPGVQGTLVRLGTAPTYTYVLTSTAQTVETFDRDGYLQEIRDAQGHTTTLSYSSTVTCTNVLQRVTGPDADPNADRYLEFAYNDNCQVAAVQDQAGRSVAFSYDQAGDLVVVTDTRGFAWTYSYTGTHLLYEVIDPNDHLVEKTDYDSTGRAVRQWTGDVPTPTLVLDFVAGGARVLTDARAISQTVHYNTRNTWAGTLDAAGYPITRTYDANFNLDYTADANGNPTEIDWNACGCRPSQVTDTLGGATTMTYDERNNLTSYTDTGEHTTHYYYAPGTSLLLSTTNELSLTTYYTYSQGVPGVPDGLLIELASPRDHHTRYQYDAYGQMRSTAVLSGGNWITTTTYACDEWGRTISTTTFGRADATYYDAAGHVTRTVQNCTAGDYEDCRTVQYDAGHPDRNIVTENLYDPAGILVLVTDTLGVVSFYEYDDANRLVRMVENYDPARGQNEGNLYNIATHYGYDAAGNQVRVTSTLGMLTWTGYDELNRAIAVTVNYTTTAPNPDPTTYNLVTTYGYDPAGNQVTVTNAGGVVTLNRYDPLNRLVTTTVNYTTTTPNPDPARYNLVTTYGYDAAGNQVTVTNPLLVKTVTAYDELNRVERVTQNYVNGAYDAAAPDEDVYTQYRYDDAGRQSAVGLLGMYTTTYGYDALGRQTTVTDPLAHTITSTYDAQGRLAATYDASGHRTTYGYDVLGRTIAVTDALTHTTRYAYDGLGRRTAETNAAGIVTLYQYDLLGRLTAETANYSPTGGLDTQTNVHTVYGYDALGNRMRVVNARGNTTTYEYDALSRLIAQTDPEDHTWEYGYDTLGRQVVVTDPLTVTTRVYDEPGRLLAVEYGDSVSATYAYNALGSRLVMTDTTGVTEYLHDDLGRIVLLTHTVDGTLAYTVGYGYDGRGLRTLLVYPDGTRVTSTYDLAGRLTAVDGVTTTYAVYDYDDGSRLVSATLGNGVKSFYAYDVADHLRMITHTHDGDLLSRFAYEYDATGNRTRAAETVVADLGLEVFGGELAPPTMTIPAGPFHIYLPVVRWEPAAVVAGRTGSGGVSAPLPFDPALGPGGQAAQGRAGEPIVRDKKAFRATFDVQRVRYSPRERLVQVGNYYVDFHLVQVRSGQTKLFHPGAPQNPPTSPPGQPDLVRYDRGGYFREEYVITAGGLEQRFVFSQPFPVDGDLEIEATLQGNLEPSMQGSGEIEFLSPSGETVASYGRALVEEACGERLEAEMTLQGSHLRIAIPRAWLEHACFPLLVDPLIGPNFALSTQPISGNQERVSVAYGGTGTYLAAWHGAGNGSDVFAQVISSQGMLISRTVSLDTRKLDQQYPDAAGDAADAEYLVVWQHNAGSAGVPDWDICGRYAEATGTLSGTLITVYPGSYNQQYPAVAFNTDARNYLVVWQSYDTASKLYGIYGRTVQRNGNLGLVQTIYTSATQLAYPDVAFNAATGQYLVVWQRYISPASGWDVLGMRVAADGSPIQSAIEIGTGTNDQTVPAVVYSPSDTQYLVAWQSYVDARNLNDVRSRWVDGSGTPGIAINIATGSDDQRAPDAACSGNGECLVVWEGHAAMGISGWDVYARRANGSGTIGNAFAVYDGLLDQRYAAVAYSTQATEYIAVWQDYRSGSNWDIYARRVGTDGMPAGQDVLVGATPASGGQSGAAVAYGSAAGYHLAVWQDSRNGNEDVYGQLVDGGGALVGGAFAITAEGAAEQAPAVAYDEAHDEYLVVWQRQDGMTGQWDLYGRRVGGDGTFPGSPIALCVAAGDQSNPAVSYDGKMGSFLVAWEDARSGSQDIYARALPGGSDTPGAEFAVYSGDGAQRSPDVAADEEEGRYLVVWQDGRNGNDDVYGRLVASTAPAGDPFPITTATRDQQQPAVAWSAGWGEYVVVWEHQNGSDDDVHGRRVSGAGALLGSEITVTSGVAEQTCPAVAANETGGGWTVAWQEGATNGDIHAVHVDGTGDLLGVEEDISEAANSQERPALSYDAGRGRYLAVWADYRHAGSGPDVYGQLLRDYTTVVEYTYDPLSRLVGAEYSTGIEFGYTYDAAGNRTHLTETTPLSGTIATTYTYDKANRLTARAVSDGRGYTYSWSQRGELLAETTQGVDVRTFEWDAAGRLAQATVFTLTTYFTYAGDGTRVALEVEGVGATDFIPDRGGRIVEEHTATTSTRYLYGRDCLGEVRDGTLLYYLADGQGYVRQSSGADGAVVDAWLFTPDGGVMAGPEGPVTHLVCGGVYDWSTGLLYKGGSYFDPALGIWLALVPLVLVQGWRERRRKGRRGLVWCPLLLLIVAGLGGALVACGPVPWPTPSPTCTEVPWETRYGGSIADAAHNLLSKANSYYIWSATQPDGTDHADEYDGYAPPRKQPLPGDTWPAWERGEYEIDLQKRTSCCRAEPAPPGGRIPIVCADVIDLSYRDGGLPLETFDSWFSDPTWKGDPRRNVGSLWALLVRHDQLHQTGDGTLPKVGDMVINMSRGHSGIIAEVSGPGPTQIFVIQASYTLGVIEKRSLADWYGGQVYFGHPDPNRRGQ